MDTTENFEIENNSSLYSHNFTDLSASIGYLKTEVAKVIVGQEKVIDLIIVAVLSDGHVLLEGVPGVAKTLTANLIAKTIDTNFKRIQFTPDLMPSDVTGTSVYNNKINEFEYKKGPIFSNIILIDEINRSPAKTQAALFEVMQEKQITTDGTTFQMEFPFLIIATQNPVEQEGTYQLPEAQLDRFMFKIQVPYPTLEEEISILTRKNQLKNQDELAQINKILTPQKLKEFRSQIAQIQVDASLIKYIAQIINATRNNRSLYLGASPRASISLLNGSKALAAMRGRSFVTPEEIKYLAPSILDHRIVLAPEREMEGLTKSDVVEDIINSIEIPR